ncbi:MAG: acetylglutamate kinase [Chitinispirillales bacterium]|jgi:acetylglutamate kinase|nr:acetylglutamate kinase [Chitinispirillales bacterium]
MGTVVIKIGGSTVDASGLLQELGKSIKEIIHNDFPVIVHGGGKDIARQLDLLNKEFTFVEGMRVTDAQMVNVVQMVLSGDVNKRIVNALLMEKVNTIGFSGVDGGLFTASKMLIKGQDIGFVGEINSVNKEIITFCQQAKLTPVISPVSRGEDGAIYNVNADLAASELAMAIKADDLIFISDVPGVMIDKKVRRSIKTSEIEELISAGHVTGGMIPKLRSAAEAVHKGVKRVHICGWNGSRTLLNELTGGECAGTVIHS